MPLSQAQTKVRKILGVIEVSIQEQLVAGILVVLYQNIAKYINCNRQSSRLTCYEPVTEIPVKSINSQV